MNQNTKDTMFAAIIGSVLGLVVGSATVFAQTNSNANPDVSQPPTTNTNVNADPITPAPSPEEINDLNEQIEQKKKVIEELKRQTAIYERTLEEKQNERATLQSELRDLVTSIDVTETQLNLTQTEIEFLQLEIQKVEREIADREEEIAQDREELASLLRRVYEADQVTHLEIIVQEQSFSGFFTRVQNLHALSSSVEEALTEVLDVKRQLEIAHDELSAKRASLDEQRKKLEDEQSTLEHQEAYKENLLETTKNSEEKYQELLQELRQQASSVDTEISALIEQVRDRLKARGEDVTGVEPGELSWPVDPSKGISAYFRDPTYPFRKIFEHPAIDIRLSHGSSVSAAAEGIVAIARKLDWVRDAKGKVLWPAYNFVTIVHGGSLATVYGHLSDVAVTEGQTVKRGEIIGKSGGTPGTAGAGRLTTGPHLHFEVRVDGVPDDPLKYLSAL